MAENQQPPLAGRRPVGDVALDDERVTESLTTLFTPSQMAFVASAASARQCSAGAVVRAALEAYRRLHPTLEPPRTGR